MRQVYHFFQIMSISSSEKRQLLHWVFKITNLKRSLNFYENVLGLRVLRHEEFNSGCEAQCNGAYSRPWSKTMVGQGPENEYFVFELTYNYGIRNYEKGNDLQCILIHVADPASVLQRAAELGYQIDGKTIFCPDGYAFQLVDTNNVDSAAAHHIVQGVRLNCTKFDECCAFYQETLGLPRLKLQPDDGPARAAFGYQWHNRIELEQVMCVGIQHAEAYGRLAIAVPTDHLSAIQTAVEKSTGKVHTPLIKLDTPGKATVQVVISLDPEGFEICTVGSEGFFQLCKLFPGAEFIDWNKRQEMGDIIDP